MHGTAPLPGDGRKYSGSWANDLRSGQGTQTWQRAEHTGEWKENKMHGKGILYFPDGGDLKVSLKKESPALRVSIFSRMVLAIPVRCRAASPMAAAPRFS